MPADAKYANLAAAQSSYAAVAKAFTKGTTVFKIEILPKEGMPEGFGEIAQKDDCFAVTQPALAMAFVYAGYLFFESWPTKNPLSDDMCTASRVMLLHCSEHLTAANFRKRRLIAHEKSSSPGDVAREIRDEIAFLDSILTSPLHRHSKSPTLWHHRAWVRDLQLRCSKKTTSTAKLTMTGELNTVLEAAGQHTMNYYAWNYARRLLDENSLEIVPEEFEKLAFTVTEWACARLSDTSAWSYLAAMILFMLQGWEVEVPTAILDHVVEKLTHVRWAGEATEHFLRQVLEQYPKFWSWGGNNDLRVNIMRYMDNLPKLRLQSGMYKKLARIPVRHS